MSVTPVMPWSDGARPTLASALVARLREAIMRGDLPPGAKLHLEDLREHYAVSLSPLREALSRLGSEGLVLIEDQRGYRVAPVSDDNLAEVTRLRVELEPMALRESMNHGDDEWRERIRLAHLDLDARSRAIIDSSTMEAWETAHRRYHLALLSACRMPLLIAFITTLHDLTDRYRRIFLTRYPKDRDVPGEHARIQDAVLGLETDVACALLRQHIERTGRNVRLALSDPAPD